MDFWLEKIVFWDQILQLFVNVKFKFLSNESWLFIQCLNVFALQLYREQLREDHNDNMLTILNEFGDLKKKRSFLLRNPVFNGISILKSLMKPF